MNLPSSRSSKLNQLLHYRFSKIFLGFALFWYMVLGLRTQLALLERYPLPANLMSDLAVYLSAYKMAAQHIDPYTLGNEFIRFLYPLPSLLVIAPFALVANDFLRASIYIAVNLVLLIIMLCEVARRYGYHFQCVWWWFPLAFFFAPFLELLQIGQINLISSFGIFLMFIYADSIPGLAGLGWVLGAVTKFTPAIFLVYLAFRRYWRAAIWALVFLVFAYGLTFMFFGWQSPLRFVESINSLTHLFMPGPNSNALVSSLVSLGWIQRSAWPEMQNLMLVWVVLACAASGVSAWRTNEWEPFFVVTSLGMAVSPNHMWYHHYVFILLALFVWMAWSKLNPMIVAWIVLGMTLIQVDRWYWTQGILPHVFVHVSILGILIWQFGRMWRSARFERMAVSIGIAIAAMGVLWYGRGVALANANILSAQAWMGANIPQGARIASEIFTSQVDSEKYTSEEFQGLFAHSSEWYEQEGWEYIVTHYGTHGRFSAASLLPFSSQRYDDFISPFSLMTRVVNGDYEIRVYKTGVQLPSHRVAARFGMFPDWIELVSYDALSPSDLVFYWRPLVTRRDKLTLATRVLDCNDQEVARSDADLFGGNYADDRWQTGLIRVPWKIDLPKNLEPGIYRIELSIDSSAAGRVPMLIDHKMADDHLLLDSIKLAMTPPSTHDLRNAQVVNAQFGNEFSLRAYSANEQLRLGESLTVTLYWQSITETDKDYTVFVHLLDANGKMVAQLDAPPRGGAYPTSIWDAGEIIRDDYIFPLPKDLATGDYKIEIGAYGYPSLTRLPIIDANGKNIGDHLILDTAVKLR